MIYVPDKENYKCFVVRSEEVIRAYKEIPVLNEEVSYRDYYIHSDYMFNDSSEIITENLPVCLDNSLLTNEVYYRVDFYKSMIIFFIFCIFCFLIPIKIVFRFFRRFN